jgi:hypothetical protein
MRRLLLFALAIAACSKGPEADLPSIGAARSLAAEWALVNDLASQGKLTPTYVQTMRKSMRGQLQTASRSLTKPQSAYATEIDALLREPDDAPPERLRAHAEKLRRFEDGLESA